MEQNTAGRNDTFDLGGAFVNGFNSGNYATSYPADNDFSFNRTDTGHDTLPSSPEQMNRDNLTDGATTNITTDSNGVTLNPRSCVTCRKRKVRCDKHEPCSNCVKASVQCVFPPPGRAPRKPRKPQDAELLKRLRRLESVVDSLGAQVDDDGHVRESKNATQERQSISTDIDHDGGIDRRSSLEHGLGRLILKDGKSRYVSNEFWASLGEEINDIRHVLDGGSSSEEEEYEASKGVQSESYGQHQGFLFGYSSLMYDMSKLHPHPSQIFILWETFKENVDPVVKIIHVPCAKNIIMKAAVSSQNLSKANEAIFYSICFAAVVSMQEEQTKQLLGENKNVLMQKYRFAVEQALSRASFLSSSSLMVLQAFVLFLTTVKYIDTTRSIWALSGLAMQQAQAQGLHRDGTNFKLKPYETEIRRRLWWHISHLDSRASEDYGADPTFSDHPYDTRMPLNVNDDEIWPDMTEPPKERVGASDMTFSLVRCELGLMSKKIRIMASAETDDSKKRTVKEKETLIDAAHQRMHDKYFSHCDPTVPLLWLSSTIGKLILAKMWLYVHHPRLFTDDTKANNDLKEQVFVTSVEVIEFGSLLDRGKHTSKWAWLFHTYNQWHAVTYVLSELCTRQPGPVYDRAWTAVNEVYDRRMLEFPLRQRGVLWKPIRQLYNRARKRREALGLNHSPKSVPESTRSLSTDSPDVVNSGPSSFDENWMGTNPYIDATSSNGDAFGGLDFNAPLFNEMDFSSISNVYSMPEMSGNPSQKTNPLKTPLDTLPFGWTPYVTDYFAAPGSAWTAQSKQEWQ